MRSEVSPPDAECRPLRADAARNRELILDAAAELFAAHGLDVGYEEIARCAGVGVGTVYRRFPERVALVQALFESRVDELAAIAEEAASHPDAWQGLVQFLERTLERQVADRGLREVMVHTITSDVHMAIGRDRMWPVLEALVDRAHRAGALRCDVGATDLAPHLMMLSSVALPGCPDLWRRPLALLLEALRARPDQEPMPGTAPDEETMYALMSGMRARHT